ADGRLARLSVRGDSTLPAPRPILNPATTPAANIGGQKPPPPAPPDPELLAARERICGKAIVDALEHNIPPKTRILGLERRFNLEPGGPCPAGAETIANDSAQFACRLGGASTVGPLVAMPGEVAAQLGRYDLVVQLSDIMRAPHGSSPQRGIVY